MFKMIYPTYDATIYSRYPERNTGADQILELTKVASGSAIENVDGNHEYWNENYNTRMLLNFNINDVSKSISDLGVSDPKFYLTIKSTEAIHLPIGYTLYSYPMSSSWTNGTGYHNNKREVTNGVSWKYKNGKASGVEWDNVGGDYYSTSSLECTQLFTYEQPDIRMDVTKIINAWLSNEIPQHGIIIKHSSTVEDDSSEVGSIKFFSKDTHTIYIPRLEVYWDDVDVSGTGSISIINDEYTVYIKNLKESYYEDEIAKLRIGVRSKFPTRSYSVVNANLSVNRLLYNSYYQVMDSRTDEVIVPFNDIGTRISCDTLGNYIVLDMESFLPERFYKIIFKSKSINENNYIDDGFWFKVNRK